MKVGICLTKKNVNGTATSNAFWHGVTFSGDTAIVIDERNTSQLYNCDCAFVVTDASVYKGQDLSWAVREICTGRGIHRIIADTGFFSQCNKRGDVNDCDRYLAISLDGIKNEGKYFADNSPADRWNQLGITIKKWQLNPNRPVLVFGQNEQGLSVQNFDFLTWLSSLIKQLNQFNIPILFRKHPEQKTLPEGIYKISTGTLQEDLIDINATWGYSTNAQIDAIIEGIPSKAISDKSMLSLLNMKNREQWLYNLAYCQWNLSEISNGIPWRRFREYV